eukprot:SRR837773.15526.p1 GENE.SRR837773.15526~~SRR837773.15526.p1  ORF type:complete len:327 (-),score=84.88 SRR837773.15526:92-1072(-)
MPIKEEVSRQLTGHWKHELFKAPCAAPGQCLYGCLCTCCAVYQQREELLRLTGEPYVCCAGLCPCGPLGQPMDKSCLIIEACCCTGWALSGNRFMIQTRFDKENTPCDDCILWGTCMFICALNIARCFVDLPDELEFCADCLIMSVNGCMHAQQHLEIQEVKRSGYTGPPASVMNILPPTQQEMIKMGKQGGGGGAFGAPPQAYGNAGAGRPVPQQMQQPRPQQMMQQQQQPSVIQVQCGTCRQIFGSPQSGCTVACPHCSTHNQVPFVGGAQPGYGGGGGMYGGGGGMYGGQQQQQRSGMGTGAAVAGGAVAGAVGGMVLADMMF